MRQARRSWIVRRPGDCPRVCGGNVKAFLADGSCLGLSPRVRGKRGRRRGNKSSCRSIPACAGETASAYAGRDYNEVYPRVCGGNLCRCQRPARCIGLSPRVRGKPSGSRIRGDTPWSIPACAGETPVWDAGMAGGRVYPRVCGGNTPTSLSLPSPTGLSPRVRGKRMCGTPGRRGVGSIPACAGETDS